jgi:hypothetical protein
MSDRLFARRGRDGAIRVLYPYRLPDLYAELNGRFWSGQLPPALSLPQAVAGPIGAQPRFVLLRRVSCRLPARARRGLRGYTGSRAFGLRAVGTFRPPWLTGPARILIAAPLGADRERQALLHEMIHCGLWFAGFPTEAHGPRFVAELDRLARAGEPWARDAAAESREHPQET